MARWPTASGPPGHSATAEVGAIRALGCSQDHRRAGAWSAARRPRGPHRHAAGVDPGRALPAERRWGAPRAGPAVGGRTGIPRCRTPSSCRGHGVQRRTVPGALARLARRCRSTKRRRPSPLVERLGLPTRLSDVSVSDEDLGPWPAFRGGSVQANPRPVSEDGALAIPRVGVRGSSGGSSVPRPPGGGATSARGTARCPRGRRRRINAVLLVVSIARTAGPRPGPSPRRGRAPRDRRARFFPAGAGHLLEGDRSAVDRRREHHVLVPAGRHLDAERLAPEQTEPVGVRAVDDQVGETSDGGHERRG